MRNRGRRHVSMEDIPEDEIEIDTNAGKVDDHPTEQEVQEVTESDMIVPESVEDIEAMNLSEDVFKRPLEIDIPQERKRRPRRFAVLGAAEDVYIDVEN